MTMSEVMNQPDKEQFLLAMKKELEDHIARKHWKVVPASTVLTHKRCLSIVWSMKRKRNPVGEIIKWKARLYAGGHRSIEVVDYWDTYSPVVCWQTIRLVFILALIKKWYIHSIDFVLAFSQAQVQNDIFIQPPKVSYKFNILDLLRPSERYTKVYKLLKNLYELKDAG